MITINARMAGVLGVGYEYTAATVINIRTLTSGCAGSGVGTGGSEAVVGVGAGCWRTGTGYGVGWEGGTRECRRSSIATNTRRWLTGATYKITHRIR